MLRLITLGSLELADGDRTLPVRRRKALVLLAYLARRRRPVARTELATLLWGDRSDDKAKQSLRQALSDLRDLVGDSLDAGLADVGLKDGTVLWDVADFEAAVAAGRLEEAIRLAPGRFLAGVDEAIPESGLAWIDQERAALDRQVAWTLERLVAAELSKGDRQAALAWAERWCGLEPHGEAPERQRFVLLVELARPGEALAHHAEFVHRLKADLEASPSGDFSRLVDGVGPAPVVNEAGMRGFVTPDLVGREEQLGLLTRAWDAVRVGEARAVVIEGEEGYGKSRLLEEFLRLVRSRPDRALILEARGFAAEPERDFVTARDLLGPLASAPGIGGAPPEALATLAGIVPGIRERFRTLPPASPGREPTDDVTRVITDVAEEIPVVIAVDDAPTADRATQTLLAEWVRRPPRRVLLVLAGRRLDLGTSAFRDDLATTGPRYLRISLPVLTAHELERLVGSMVPFEPASLQSLSIWLARETGGVPAHARRLVDYLAAQGILAPGPRGRWRLTAEPGRAGLPVGTGEREIMLERLSRLSPDARSVTEAVSALGVSGDPLVLEAVSGLAPEPFRTALAEAMSRRLLRETSPGRSDFLSEGNRRAVYNLLAPSRQRELHSQIARRLESVTPRTDLLRVEIAGHWSRAGGRPARRGRWWAAAGLAAAVTAGWLVVRTSDGAARVDAGSQVLLADVQNQTGDSTLDRALYVAATIGLEQSRHVSFFPRSRIGETLRRMGSKAGDTTLSEPLAREIAQRENLKMVVLLGIARVDSTYLLSARLVDPRSGANLRSDQVEVEGRGRILEGLDRLVNRTRRSLGETRRDVASGSGLLTATTPSLEALKAYSEGAQAWGRREFARAGELWRRAVSLDSNFALAHQSLADYMYNQANDRPAGDYHLKRALAQLDRLTEPEQLRIRYADAFYHQRSDEAIGIVRTLAERYPSRLTWGNLGTALFRTGRCREAIPALRRALDFDSAYSAALINIASCYQLLGRLDSSLAAYTAAARVDSLILYSSNLNHEWGMALVRTGRTAEAESVHRVMAGTGDESSRARGNRSLAYLAQYQGRMRDAAAHQLATLDPSPAGGPLTVFRNTLILANIYLTTGDRLKARDLITRAESMVPTLRLEPSYYLYLGYAELRAGQLDRAQRTASELARIADSTRPGDRVVERILASLIANRRGKPQRGLAISPADSTALEHAFFLQARAEEFAATGRLDSATATAARLATSWFYGTEAQLPWMAAPLALARYAELVGDSGTARAALSQFIERWKNGDQDLPDLLDARRTLARLQAAVPR